MQHQLCQDLYQYWGSLPVENGLPLLEEFVPEKLPSLKENGLIFSLHNNEIIIDYLGSRTKAVLSKDLVGRSITDLYPPSLKAMQMALMMPCITHKVGLVRRSRLWFGHRHKDVEWLLLPVWDGERQGVGVVGLSVSFVEKDDRDEVVVGSPLVERLVAINYLPRGQAFNVAGLDSHSRAVLDAMGAKLMVDGNVIPPDDRGIAGDAGLVAAKVAQPNVLAVVGENEIGNVAERLGGRYNLRVVESHTEALAILKNDMIDVLVTSETGDHGAGLELIKEAQTVSAFTACVVMLDRKDEAEDARFLEQGSLTHHLVKPVGEFALRQALDDAGRHADRARRDDAS